jgi:hypothetical protein
MKKILYILLFLPILIVAQSTTENHIKNTTYKVETTNGTTKVSGGAIANDEKQISISYFDGLGRPKQSVVLGAGGNKEDIITHIGYDEFGRQAKDFLPYANGSYNGAIRTGNLETATQTFYKNKYPTDFEGLSTTAVNAYSQKVFDGSPGTRYFKPRQKGSNIGTCSHNKGLVKLYES